MVEGQRESTMNFKEHVSLASEQLPVLTGLSSCANLDQAFRFLESVGFAVAKMELLSQDEFTLDLVFPFDDSNRCVVLAAS